MEQFNKLLPPSFSYQKGIIHDEQFVYSINWHPCEEIFMKCKKFKDNSKIMPKIPIKKKKKIIPKALDIPYFKNKMLI